MTDRNLGIGKGTVWLLLVVGFAFGMFSETWQGALLWGQLPPKPAVNEQDPLQYQGQPVVELRYEGNEKVPDTKVNPYVRLRKGREFDIDAVESDVRQLISSGLFVDVRPFYQKVPDGVIVIYRMVERPRLEKIEFVGMKRTPIIFGLGNIGIKEKHLRDEVGLEEGDSVDPVAISDAARRIEDYYHSKGYNHVRVDVLEGNKIGDRNAVFQIFEGPVQRVSAIRFEGNEIVSGGRLKTQIQTKKMIAGLFGKYNPEILEGDVDRLVAYYHGLGYWNVRVGREVKFNEEGDRVTVRFVIDEGIRFKVRDISFVGNEVFSTAELSSELKLKADNGYLQADLEEDLTFIRDHYGSQGYIYADIKPDIRYLDQPGMLDVVYEISEGAQYRVGRINVVVNGDYPHTKITTVLNRLSVKPGDVIDVRELRASERRLRASGLFLNDPARGISPTIAYGKPNLGGRQLASRGQSPEIDLEVDGVWPEGYTPPQAFQAPKPETNDKGSVWHVPAGGKFPMPGDYPDGTSSTLPAMHPSHLPERLPEATPKQSSLPPSEPLRNQAHYPSGSFSQFSPQQLPPKVQPVQYAQAPRGYVARGQGPGPSPYQPYPNNPTNPNRPLPSTGNPNSSFTPTPVPSFPQTTNPGSPPPPSYYEAVPPGTPANPLPSPGTTVVPPGEGPGTILPIPPENPPLMEPWEMGPTQDLNVTVEETETGRLSFGVGVNSDAGLIGQVTVDEQNFDWLRFPRGWADFRDGQAFRGGGQRFRLEAVPGTDVSRYVVSLTEPYAFDTAYSLSVSGSYYTRFYDDWEENRTGGRVAIGRAITHDLSLSFAFRGEDVEIRDPTVPTPPELAEAVGNNTLLGFRVSLTHDTRDSTFLPTEGHYFETSFEQVLGDFVYPRFSAEYRQYFLLGQRFDGSGRRTLTVGGQMGITGEDTPIYDRFYAGGYRTLRGFDFRGVTPRSLGVGVGGDFMAIGTVEYQMPITANDLFRGVVFLDAGTVEDEVEIDWDNFRVAPGVGFLVSIQALGPAPLAFYFGFPIATGEGDDERIFTFSLGAIR
ncbi:Hypothetical protein PBC10988_34480 [Planctomycetales bacterium 10988]|nr:Hypothetical protein PBC10988_34480 [Planctomycetales bacterium 10988]